MPLSVGQSVLVQYAPDQQWKERVIVLHVKENDYWAVSPSYGLFLVILGVPPVHQMRLLPPSRELPTGVEEANCDLVHVATPTGFFTDSELRSFEEEARSLAGVGHSAPSGLDGDSPPAAATRLQGAPPTTGHVWVVGMPPPGSQLRLGDVLNVPAAVEPDGVVLLPPKWRHPCYLPVHGEEVLVLSYYVPVEERKEFVDMRLQDIRGVRASEDLLGVDAIGDDERTMPFKRREVTGERFCPFESSASSSQGQLTPMQAIRGSTLCDICGLRTSQVRDCDVCDRMFCWGPLATPCGAIAIHGQRCWLCWESPDIVESRAAPAEPGQTESCAPAGDVGEQPGNCMGGHRGPGSAEQ